MAYNTTLKRKLNGTNQIVYPQTIADLVFLNAPNIKKHDLKSVVVDFAQRIIELEEKSKTSNHFKGAFDSVYALEQWYKNNNVTPVAGDYAIIKRKAGNDFFIVWDADAKTWNDQGIVMESLVKSVNGMQGIVVVNGTNIEVKYDTMTTNAILNDILTEFNNRINANKNDIVEHNELIQDIQEDIERLSGRVQVAEGEYLKHSGLWTDGTKYEVNDIVSVTSSQNLYICKKEHTAETSNSPDKEGGETYWEIFVEGFSGKYSDLTGAPENLVTKDQLEGAIGAIPTPDVSGQINAHNQDETAHPYILSQLEELRNLLPTVTILEE
jgi:hypothetical protein